MSISIDLPKKTLEYKDDRTNKSLELLDKAVTEYNYEKSKKIKPDVSGERADL